MSSSSAGSSRASRRCAVAAAGIGLAIASLGAASAATAAPASHHVAGHRRAAPARAAHPDIAPPTPAVTITNGSPVEIPVPTLVTGTSVALASLTITDPGLLHSTDVITLTLYDLAGDSSLDTASIPTVTVSTGASAAAVTVTGTTVTFTITKTAQSLDATYAVSGIHLVGTAQATSGAFGFGLTAVYNAGTVNSPDFETEADVHATPDGAVTHILPAAYGPTSPDTAAVLFRAEAFRDTPSVVLASDSEPQDAESANYLAAGLLYTQNTHTGILLTDPTTLSPAASSVLNDYTDIQTVYIVGGTSVVSAAVADQLTSDSYTVVRLAGQTQYDTNATVDDYVTDNLSSGPSDAGIDYTQTKYNSTTGASSPTTTYVGVVPTAIVASGSIESFQDGIVSGPMSSRGRLPVVLTTPASLSPTALTLLTEAGIKQVILLGGPAAVSDAVEAQLTAPTADGGAGVVVFRIAGADASDTSTKLAEFLDDGDSGFQNFDNNIATPDGGVLIARGTGFQDALAAGPYGGETGDTPILLTENATVLGAPLTGYLEAAGRGCLFSVQAIGGPLSVTPAVQQAAVDAEFSGLAGCDVEPPVVG